MYCKNCANEIECTKHLVYECQNVKQIWHIIGTILKVIPGEEGFGTDFFQFEIIIKNGF